MKTLLSTVAASVMLVTGATAFAASTVDLAVKGLIVPSACTPTLSGGGIIDHGKISAKDLRPNNPTLSPHPPEHPEKRPEKRPEKCRNPDAQRPDSATIRRISRVT